MSYTLPFCKDKEEEETLPSILSPILLSAKGGLIVGGLGWSNNRDLIV